MDNADVPLSQEMIEFATSLINAKDDERFVVLMMKLFLMEPGVLERVLSVPKIERHRFEFNVGVGRVDLILFHKDGGITLVELKANAEVRTVAAGIGQLFLYEAALPIALKKKAKQPKYIRKVLASPIEPEKSIPVVDACRAAGVHYAHLGGYKDLQKALSKAGWKDGA